MPARDVRAALDMPIENLARRALKPVEVAVIDSGIDATHPDLAGHVTASYRVKADHSGAHLVAGRRRANQDTYGHGTAVASIIRRIAANARLIDIRVLDPGNVGSPDALAVGLAGAVEHGWKLINMSLAASPSVARRLMPLCEKAAFQGQVVVAARRNLPVPDEGYPAAFSSVLGVDSDAMPSAYQYGFQAGPIEWQAAGEGVAVAAMGGGYTTKTGTSFATPAITGICALLLGAFPDLTPFEIKTVLKAHAMRKHPTPRRKMA